MQILTAMVLIAGAVGPKGAEISRTVGSFGVLESAGLVNPDYITRYERSATMLHRHKEQATHCL
jgi:hypothetical protein